MDKIGGNFGLNVNINLDRDRNCIPDLNQRNTEAHKLISNALKNLKESNDVSDRYDFNYLNKPEFSTATSELLREIPQRISNPFIMVMALLNIFIRRLKERERHYYLMNGKKIRKKWSKS